MTPVLARALSVLQMIAGALPCTAPSSVIARPCQEKPGQEKPAGKTADASDAFFKRGEIPYLKIQIAAEDVEKLRTSPREYVPCSIRENDKVVHEGVSIKLKGAAGSFREFDDKPGLTLRMDRVDHDRRFHGLAKFHLNNAVQDDTYLREFLGSEVFRAAGVATPRITHARVWLNERDVGFYVLKEGFDKLLVKRFWDEASGNLYDGGFCQDVDADLNKECGKGPDDHSDLKRLRETCLQSDLTKRWPRLAELVDIHAFITFMAVEFMTCHWDGYCINRNNYRVYIQPKSGKAYFLAHGMDQVFQDPNASILDAPAAMIATSVMKKPEWRAEYRRRIGELLPLFDADKLGRRLDEASRRIDVVLEKMGHETAQAHEGAVRELKRLLELRERSLREQKTQPDPRPLVFSPGVAVRVDSWHPMSESEDAKVEEERIGGERFLVVACGQSGQCVAGYRRSVLLSKGKYRLQATMIVKGVAALTEEGAPGVGAGLRVAGAARENSLIGTAGAKTVQLEFEVAEEQTDVELVVELRASKGELRIRPESLKLTKLPP